MVPQINNLSAKINKYRDQIHHSINRVMENGWLILGPEVKRFEQLFANYLGVQNCITLGNGTDAIELALKALGVQRGDRVATVANAGMYTTTALLTIGADPYFMDVDMNTHCVTLAEVMRAVNSGVKAVVVTHLYGLAVPEIEQIAKYCAQQNIPLLEDCAQAHGAVINNKRIGSFGNAASFSFYPTKNLGALGDGGAVVTSDAALAEKIHSLRQYGWLSKYKVNSLGGRNSRLDEIQAAILSEFLPDLDKANNRRREIAAAYSNDIKLDKIVLPEIRGTNYVAHLYVIRTPQREILQQYLKQKNIASDIHYPIPDYKQPVFGAQFSTVSLSNTEKLAEEILTLPCYPEMSDADVNYVITSINGWQV